jgi:hypothetical protein
MDVLGRTVRGGEREVALQQGAHVGCRRVVDADLSGGHGANVGNERAGDKQVRRSLAGPVLGVLGSWLW